MAQDPPKRQWKTGTDYEEGKREGVTAVLTRAGVDEKYRTRLLSKNPQEVLDAFNEEGNFEKLPYGFRIECFERSADIDPAQTDNAVMLLLPEVGTLSVNLPEGGEQWWQCTYLPYKPS
ncbi:MAG: hypothetical protein QOI49_1785 [Verrucomicrobiota bacterium]|jgi:hypothetical protein